MGVGAKPSHNWKAPQNNPKRGDVKLLNRKRPYRLVEDQPCKRRKTFGGTKTTPQRRAIRTSGQKKHVTAPAFWTENVPERTKLKASPDGKIGGRGYQTKLWFWKPGGPFWKVVGQSAENASQNVAALDRRKLPRVLTAPVGRKRKISWELRQKNAVGGF